MKYLQKNEQKNEQNSEHFFLELIVLKSYIQSKSVHKSVQKSVHEIDLFGQLCNCSIIVYLHNKLFKKVYSLMYHTFSIIDHEILLSGLP